MASIRKLPSGKWNVRVIRKGHPLQIKSFINRTDADKWARATEAAMDAGTFFDRTEAEATTLTEALERYVNKLHGERFGQVRIDSTLGNH